MKSFLRKVLVHYPFTRGRSRLTQFLSKHIDIGRDTVVSFDGDLSIQLHPMQFISKQIYFFGIFEPLETKLFKNSLREGMVVLDIGANIGLFTLISAKIIGEAGHVYAFEPSQDNFQILERNVLLNHFNDKVSLIKAAVASETMSGKLLLAKDGGSHSITFSGVKNNVPIEDVDFVRIDDFVQLRSLSRIDVIKVDAEGADFEVLKGAVETLRKFSPMLFVEFAERTLCKFGTTPKEMLDFIISFGYKPYRITKSGLKSLEIDSDISNINLFFTK